MLGRERESAAYWRAVVLFLELFFFAAGKFQTIYSKRARNTLKQTNEYLFPRKKIMHSHTHSYVYRMGTALCGEEDEEEEEDVTSWRTRKNVTPDTLI